MRKLFLFGLVMLFGFCCFSQNCIDTSFRKLYSSPNASLLNYQYFIDKNDVTFLVGNYINNNTADTEAYVIKLSSTNNIIWSKKINMRVNYHGIIFLNGILELDNGDIIINTLTPIFDNTINLIKLNKNGDLIWTKTILTGNSLTGTSDYRLYAYENELYACYMTETNFSNDFFSCSVIKLDTAANILWSNYYGKNYGCTSAIPIGLTEVNNDLLVFGRMFPSGCNSNITSTTESSYYGMKISKRDGSLEKSVAYRNPIDFGNTGTGIGGVLNYYANITLANNGQFYLSGLEGFKRNSYKVRFDADLNMYSGYGYSTMPGAFSPGKINVDPQGNTNILYTNNFLVQTPYEYFGNYDSSNNIIRQMRIISTVNNVSYYGGFNPLAYKRNYLSLATNNINNDGSYLQIFQLNNDEQNSSCYGKDTNFITIKPYPFTIDRSPFFDGAYQLPVIVNDLPNVTVSPLIVTEEDYCEQISDCSVLKIIPSKDTICDTSRSYIFTAHKNATCYKHVFWQIDTSAISQLIPLDDTTVSIQFKKSWQGYLYASINSCTDLKDSFKINVFQSPHSIALGNDTTICNNTTLKLNAGNDFKTYRWQDNSTDSFFIVKKTGSYFVTATDHCGNLFSDTIYIIVDTPAAIHLGNDTSICSNQQLLLNAGKGFTNYQWNTDSTTQSVTAKSMGVYSVTATDSIGCIAKDSIKIVDVFPAPTVSLNKSNVLCLNQNNSLHAGAGFANYLWQDGSVDSNFIVTIPGFYKVTVRDTRNCFAADSVTILSIAAAPANFLPADSAVCSFEPLVLQALQSFNEYLWSTGSANSSISVQQPGVYWLQVKDKNLCTGTDTINIIAKDCLTHFFVPNSFTPNNDGLNDTFKPLISGDIVSYEFSVYNRYGQLLFKTNDAKSGWDGSFKNAPQSSAAFVWYCRYQAKNELMKVAKGTVLLIR